MFCELEISNGKLNGCVLDDFLGHKYYSFHAIPYAKPPIGKLRFKDPEPIDNWNGVLNATVDNTGCYSKDTMLQIITGSEDCLYLNVYTKSITSEKKLPVMFWIHGGAFTYGSNTTEIYSPDFLITQDIVLVTINYRLGALGFLSLENPELEVTGNVAFKDMIMALKWVQTNIHYFSGDPNNVTIFGNSAGAAAVHLLILSKLATGLFHKAIIQSGTALNPWAEGKMFARNLLEHLNFDGDINNEQEILDYLQSIPVEELFQAQIKLKDNLQPKEKRFFGFILENPNLKHPFLTKHPVEIIKSGDYNHVPIIIGFTNAEGMFFELMFKKLGIFKFITDYQNFIPYNMNLEYNSNEAKSAAHQICDFYYGLEEPSEDNIESHNNLQSDVLFLHGIYTSVKQHLSTTNMPIYFYRFSLDGRLSIIKKLTDINKSGACHSDELNYLFCNVYTKNIEINDFEKESIMRMVQMWTNFAKNGNPNPIKNTDLIWESVKLNNIVYFDIGNDLMKDKNAERERIQFWDQLYHTYKQFSKL